MDKETLSNYGWIVICVLVLAVMIALATPFGTFVADAVKSTTQGLFDVNQNALNSTGLINIGDQSFGESGNGGNGVTGDSGDAGDQGGTGESADTGTEDSGETGGQGNQGNANILPEVGKTAEEYTWAEIKAISEAGKADEYFNIGDTKTFILKDNANSVVTMQMIAFDADTKADGSGTAGITWLIKSVTNLRHSMNSDNTNAGGWKESELREWLQNDCTNLFPEDVLSVITMVEKSYYDKTTQSTKTCNDTLWIPSYREMFGNSSGDTNYETYGPDYTEFFASSNARRKYSNYWTRTPVFSYENRFWDVDANGNKNYSTFANADGYVVFGFCT